MQLLIEIALRLNLHVRSHPGSTKSSVSRIPPPEMLWGFSGENDHKVIIAVWASIPACSGAKEVNPFRVIHSHQPADDLSQHGITRRGRLRHLGLCVLHGLVPFIVCHNLPRQIRTLFRATIYLPYHVPQSRR